MSRNRSAIPGLSLFPFLAVLLSTMGILVLLLFVSIRMAAQAAAADQENSSAAVEQELQQLEAGTSLANIRIAGWEEARLRLNDRLQSSRIRQNTLLSQLDELKSEVNDLQSQLAASDQAPGGNDTEQLDSLKREAETLRASIASAQAEPEAESVQQASVMYNLVPTQSPGGTARRPIYVECTGSAVVLQPLGIRLTAADFAAPEMPGNPLDAALSEIREYWLRNDVAGDQGRPYPLLVVRPEGASAWAATRRAMQGWSDEFGYELVADDLSLDFGPSDPVLAERVNAAIARARQTMAAFQRQRQEQQRLHEAAQQSQLAALVSGMKASRTSGGFVTSGAPAPGAKGGFADDHRDSRTGDGFGNGNSADGNAGEFSETQEALAGDGKGELSSGQNGPAGSPEGSSTDSNSGANAGGGNASGSQASSGASAPCLAEQRGSDWALQKTDQQTTGYRRPIVAWCDGESLRLEPGELTWMAAETVSLSVDPGSVGDQVAVSVRRFVEGWGAPPERGFWRPELRIRVLPGGEQKVAELRQLLRDSGIELGETRQP